jgi:hypothetical protein
LPDVEEEIALCSIGSSVVAIIGVVPLLQCRGVEMYAVDDGICSVIPIAGESNEISEVDETHCL